MFPEGFISIDQIRLEADASSKKRALEFVAALLSGDGNEEIATSIFDCLLERERLGSTGMGRGIALPHARSPMIKAPRGAFIRLKGSIDFDAIDDEPVDLIFGLLVPEEATSEHLQILAKLAGLFGDQEICTAIRSAPDRNTILDTLMTPPAKT